MIELEIILLIFCVLNMTLLILLLFKKNKKDNTQDLKLELREMASEIALKLMSQQGELKEHLAKQIGENNEKLSTLYYNFSKSLGEKLDKEQAELKEHLAKQIGENNEKMLKMYNDFSKSLAEWLNAAIKELNEKVDMKLDQGFKKTNETFQGILERITKIDEAQKKIEQLSTNIISLQDILSDKKSRGCFGEIQLHTILSSVFGEKNDKVYQLQYTLSNGTKADSILRCPQPLGMICIDSKFPLENYQRMMDKTLSEIERNTYEKQFRTDVKKHIDDIANKYIIEDETSDQAILFLPAEAIFAEINAYHPDIVAHAQKRRVWLTSPTTLIATLTTIEVILKNIERNKYTKIIQTELQNLSVEFERYRTRWDSLSKSIKKVNEDVNNINITTEKISKKFDVINKVEIDDETGEVKKITFTEE